MEWKYIKPLENKEVIENVESTYSVKLPIKLKEIIKKYNGGKPKNNIFDTVNSKEKVVKCLLSYNKNDRENIYIFDDLFNKGYIPFAITEFGDVICINNKMETVELYLHERDCFENVSKNIEEFMANLKKI